MHVQRHEVQVTTDASGDAVAYSEGINGILDRIVYEKGDFDNGVGFTITLEDTGEQLWVESAVNASTTRAPRQPTHASDGSASLYAGSGEPVEDLIAIDGRVKIVIALGGNAKSGTFHFLTF